MNAGPDLLKILVKKDFKLRYRRSALGFLWSLLNPLAMMMILTLVFSGFLHTTISDFSGFVLVALLIWRFFALGTSLSAWTITGNPSLVSKVYIPRYFLVLSSNLSSAIAAGMEFVVLFPLLIFLGVKLTLYALFLPLLLALELVVVFGVSLALASLNLFYRDFYQLWEITLQLGFFVTPIFYDPSQVPREFSFLFYANPLSRLIVAARKILLYNTLPSVGDLTGIALAAGVAIVLGYAVFRWLEPRFAEEV